MTGTLNKSYYSRPFNRLKYYGAWPIDTESKKKKKLFKFYQFIVLCINAALIYFFYLDLSLNIGAAKKMSWNIAVSTLFLGCISKTIILYKRSDVIIRLRDDLHKDMETRELEGSREAHKLALKHFTFVYQWLYGFVGSFAVVWISSRYNAGGTRNSLVVPLHIPFMNEENYTYIFIVITWMSVSALIYMLEQELSEFGVMLQLIREFDILIEDISKLDDVYNSECINIQGTIVVVNPSLQKLKIKKWMGFLAFRLQKLLGYIRTFEDGYSVSLLVQMLVITILSVSLGVQSILLEIDSIPDFSYQIAYLVVVMFDILLLCVLGTEIIKKTVEVGFALYSTAWYEMDRETQLDLVTMILITQKPPRITAFKAAEVDLEMYKHTMRNIYSWLTLFHQLTTKGAV